MTPAPRASYQIIELLQEVAKTTGMRKKEQKLKEFAANATPNAVDSLKKVLKYALDDFIRFGVSYPKDAEPASSADELVDIDHPSVWEMLDVLRNGVGRGSIEAKVAGIEKMIACCTLETAMLIEIIIDKDLGCGISERTVAKLFPGLLTTFSVMLAAPYEEKRVSIWPVVVEPKYDGMRVLARCTAAGSVQFYTRSGREVPSMGNFSSTVAELAAPLFQATFTELWFDGEITSGSSFNESISDARSQSDVMTDGTLILFDVITADLINAPHETIGFAGSYLERREVLENAFPNGAPVTIPMSDGGTLKIMFSPRYFASCHDEIALYYAAFREAGLEGGMVKQTNAPYIRKRSPFWMKMKAKETVDLRIKGAFEGTGQFVGMLGGIICDYKGVDVNVGSGFTPAQREELWAMFMEDMQLVESDQRDKCSLLDSLAEIQFQEVTPAGSLRHPVFVRRRLDKREVSF